jgi:hypothetical protein
MEGLFDTNGPNRSFTELGPFDDWALHLHNVFHGCHVFQAIAKKRRDVITQFPLPDRGDLERWSKAVDKQANGPAVVQPSKQFHHGLGLGLRPFARLRGTITTADNPHPTLHVLTSCFHEACTTLEPIYPSS